MIFRSFLLYDSFSTFFIQHDFQSDYFGKQVSAELPLGGDELSTHSVQTAWCDCHCVWHQTACISSTKSFPPLFNVHLISIEVHREDQKVLFTGSAHARGLLLSWVLAEVEEAAWCLACSNFVLQLRKPRAVTPWDSLFGMSAPAHSHCGLL